MDVDQDPLVSAEWLAGRLADQLRAPAASPDASSREGSLPVSLPGSVAGSMAGSLASGATTPVDATWFFPFEGRDARAEFETGHIPGAVFFDIDAVARRDTDLPHMLPSPDEFARAVQDLGVGSEDLVVVYETGAPRSAARVWWSFRAMGHDAVVVLDGGLRAWTASGGALETGPARRTARSFHVAATPRFYADMARVEAIVDGSPGQVLDARPTPRFRGEAPEPRQGLRQGRIPYSLSVPAASLYDPEGRMRAPSDLRAIFDEAGVDRAQPLVATCGSGITACMIALALRRAGGPDAEVYDGSFAEWGRPGGPPVFTGA